MVKCFKQAYTTAHHRHFTYAEAKCKCNLKVFICYILMCAYLLDFNVVNGFRASAVSERKENWMEDIWMCIVWCNDVKIATELHFSDLGIQPRRFLPTTWQHTYLCFWKLFIQVWKIRGIYEAFAGINL